MDSRHLIAYALILVIALAALIGFTRLSRRRAEDRRIRRGWRRPD